MMIEKGPDEDEKIAGFRPSNLLCEGFYPFSDLEENGYFISVFGNYAFFSGWDHSFVK